MMILESYRLFAFIPKLFHVDHVIVCVRTNLYSAMYNVKLDYDDPLLTLFPSGDLLRPVHRVMLIVNMILQILGDFRELLAEKKRGTGE